MHYRVIFAAFTTLLAFLLAGCQPSGPGGQVVYRIPILETVIQDNVGWRIVSEAPDGSYTILGSPLHFRLQGDVNIKILVSGRELPRKAQATADSGWYEPAGFGLKSGSRSFFWDIGVQLPSRVLDPSVKDFLVTFIYETFTTSSTPQPDLQIMLRLQGRDQNYTQTMPRPSDVFVGSTENTKPDNRMESSIVVRGVTLAGWLLDPYRNDGVSAGTTGSEDWHYDIFLDPDFIERNYGGSPTYGSPIIIEPIKSASLPGHVVPLIRGPATPISLLSNNLTLLTSKPTAAAFTMPGNGVFTVELNAWHKWSGARGPKPSGWQDDPDSGTYPGNAWPFNPSKGVGNSTGIDLAPGDYVIVSGTLWQDSAHSNPNPVSVDERIRKGFDDRFKGHGGWLEIHPVDAVRRVDSPQPRKHVVGFSAVYPLRPNFDTHISHPEAPPDNTAQLRFEVIVDDRFTSSNAVHAEVVELGCEPPTLRVTANVPGNGSFNATYILWWEKSNQPRTGTAKCIPAIGPILGGAAD